MDGTFAFAMPKILVHEGGKVDHPKDPGGRTNQGVTQKTYDAFRRRKKQPVRDVYEMKPAERDEIYRTQYWDAVKGDQLPQGVDYVLFDGAVNSGPQQSIKWLQRALQPVYRGVVDGVIGEQTLAAIAAWNDHDQLIGNIIKRREAFLRALKTWATFGKGWLNRIREVLKIGQAWAFGSVGPTPTFKEGSNVKATIESAKPLTKKAPADAATGGGIATTTLGGALQTAKETLTPLAGDNATISYVVTALVLAGVASAAAGIAWRVIAKRRDASLIDALDLEVVS